MGYTQKMPCYVRLEHLWMWVSEGLLQLLPTDTKGGLFLHQEDHSPRPLATDHASDAQVRSWVDMPVKAVIIYPIK
jgi:hypothetical protein